MAWEGEGVPGIVRGVVDRFRMGEADAVDQEKPEEGPQEGDRPLLRQHGRRMAGRRGSRVVSFGHGSVLLTSCGPARYCGHYASALEKDQ
jgi:hypothetical protein